MEDKKEEEHRLAEAAEGKMVEHKLEENKEEGEDKKEEEHRLAEEKGKMVENSLAEDRLAEDKLAEVQDMLELQR